MFLKAKDIIAWMEIQSYIKLTGVDIREDADQTYTVTCYLNFNNDVNGEKILYKQETELLEKVPVSELWLEKIYEKLMSLERFTNSSLVWEQ